MGVRVGNLELPGETLFFIAGPCVMENESVTLRAAEHLADLARRHSLNLIFKSSYTKANRSSVDSYTGPGIDEGLALLEKVRAECGLPVTSDVHCRTEIDAAAGVLDMLQIPAFLSRQTELITGAAATGKAINIKKGQFMSPGQMKLALEKASSTGNRNLLLTERGTFFGYGDLVVDFRGIREMRMFGYPVVYDATHSVQKPAGLGESSGGTRSMALPLMRAAVAAGVDGVFFETHPDPANALCDGPVQIPLEEAGAFIEQALSVDETVRRYRRNHSTNGS